MNSQLSRALTFWSARKINIQVTQILIIDRLVALPQSVIATECPESNVFSLRKLRGDSGAPSKKHDEIDDTEAGSGRGGGLTAVSSRASCGLVAFLGHSSPATKCSLRYLPRRRTLWVPPVVRVPPA